MSAPPSYDPDVCDLCGETVHDVVLCIALSRGMTSDSRIVPRDLRKVVCESCGLTRDGLRCESQQLQTHYGNSY